jgi:hypothetical protein
VSSTAQALQRHSATYVDIVRVRGEKFDGRVSESRFSSLREKEKSPLRNRKGLGALGMNCEVHSIYWGIIERCDGCLAVSVHT